MQPAINYAKQYANSKNWKVYEQCKTLLKASNCSPKDYEKTIKKVCRILGL